MRYEVITKKTHVKLWPGLPEEYGTGIIKIDGITRQNIGAGIGDKISIKSVEAVNAEQIVITSYSIHYTKLYDEVVLLAANSYRFLF